jgi:hypothetical protein
MATIKIAVINEYNGLTDADITPVVAALNIQVKQHFAPVWGIDADLTYYPAGNPPPLDAWQLIIFDDSDQAGALGYHDLTNMGLPLGKVFAGTDKKFGSAWSVTASHELLEMLGDPDINLCAIVEGQNQGDPSTLYAYEVCDACEDDQFAYIINVSGENVLVSDFVYPSWFESFIVPGAQFDYQKKITQPFQLMPGGYISVLQLSGSDGWIQKTARTTTRSFRMRASVGTRRERRRTPRNQWLRSTAHPGSTQPHRHTAQLSARLDAQPGFAGPMTLAINFLGGQGSLSAVLTRNGAVINQGSNTDGGDITFGDTRSGDAMALVGSCTSSASIQISTATSPGSPLTFQAGNIFDSVIIL